MLVNVKPRVVVAMSGGVDSSVAAALLVKNGFDVTGMMLRLWNEDGKQQFNQCCTPDAMLSAQQVAARLNIPFYVIDASKAFFKNVVKNFIDEYSRGRTPNPCLICNHTIRWGLLLDYAIHSGADYFATGHYARVSTNNAQEVHLMQAVDLTKDQSYVLSRLTRKQLNKTLLPLGELKKHEVRNIAKDMNFPVWRRQDSQDLCFLAGEDYRDFLTRFSPDFFTPGKIVDVFNQVLGTHLGLPRYTIGQRKGIGISADEPLYVIEKDIETNRLIVGPLRHLGKKKLIGIHVNWISENPPPDNTQLQVKIRYHSPKQLASIQSLPGDKIILNFNKPVRDITPGQTAVLYDGEICLGSSIIDSSE